MKQKPCRAQVRGSDEVSAGGGGTPRRGGVGGARASRKIVGGERGCRAEPADRGWRGGCAHRRLLDEASTTTPRHDDDLLRLRVALLPGGGLVPQLLVLALLRLLLLVLALLLLVLALLLLVLALLRLLVLALLRLLLVLLRLLRVRLLRHEGLLGFRPWHRGGRVPSWSTKISQVYE